MLAVRVLERYVINRSFELKDFNSRDAEPNSFCSEAEVQYVDENFLRLETWNDDDEDFIKLIRNSRNAKEFYSSELARI